jgi:plasmid maintenance system antidote protein VapI
MTATLTAEAVNDLVSPLVGASASCLPSGNTNGMRPKVRPSGTDVDYFVALGKSGLCALLLNNGAATPPVTVFDHGIFGSRFVSTATAPALRREEESSGGESSVNAPAATVATPDILLDEIQEALNLPTSDVADILDVSRTSVYGYINGETTIPNAHTASRLRQLLTVAREWRGLTSANMGRLWNLKGENGGPSLVAQLREPTWDWERLRATLVVLAGVADERTAYRRDQRARGFGRPRLSPADERELRRVDALLGP